MNLCTVVIEVNLVGSNLEELWIDTNVTCHACLDKNLFTFFKLIENGEKLLMGNPTTFEIQKEDKIIPKMTFEKNLTLNNMLYMLEICKNLVSGSLLKKHGFHLVFESNKVIFSKSGMFIGKGYVANSFLT